VLEVYIIVKLFSDAGHIWPTREFKVLSNIWNKGLLSFLWPSEASDVDG
jgi:hypothetical protein